MNILTVSRAFSFFAWNFHKKNQTYIDKKIYLFILMSISYIILLMLWLKFTLADL